jgi:hypothetical protein
MMVDRTDIAHLLDARRSFASVRHVAQLMARYGLIVFAIAAARAL